MGFRNPIDGQYVAQLFKWIKQHLRIKRFYGTSENAVKTQIWIAVSVYVLVAIAKKRLRAQAHCAAEASPARTVASIYSQPPRELHQLGGLPKQPGIDCQQYQCERRNCARID